jgi:CUE domain-containing protein
MDDDDVQDTGVIGGDDATNKNTTAAAPAAATATDETAPAKPPRPLTEAQKNEAILKEAFPTVDAGVIRAVLKASAGRIDPAFNALLGECIHSRREGADGGTLCVRAVCS